MHLHRAGASPTEEAALDALHAFAPRALANRHGAVLRGEWLERTAPG